MLTLCTCPDEHDVILSVLRLHPVHHQLGELVVHVGSHHDGTPAYRVHRVVHGWVTPGEAREEIKAKRASRGLGGRDDWVEGAERPGGKVDAVGGGGGGVTRKTSLCLEARGLAGEKQAVPCYASTAV
ncbi:hypothetical protein EYF80_033407 [Liparis tanakae]|uniref:Uncharacterized protein n=1 Tax=Liparis tanakae TaxID=230148 RepID=A0A4Z2GST0_9TELE|nr:hypothetical protein EYF80_033407 [Liparis tanakae]